MRIISRIQPLVFCFSDADKLLDAVAVLGKYALPCALSQFCGKYYLTLAAPLSRRRKIKTELCEFGFFCGVGVILDAYIAEHGRRICEELPGRPKNKAEEKSVPRQCF